jgi:hypothetical protein
MGEWSIGPNNHVDVLTSHHLLSVFSDCDGKQHVAQVNYVASCCFLFYTEHNGSLFLQALRNDWLTTRADYGGQPNLQKVEHNLTTTFGCESTINNRQTTIDRFARGKQLL